MNALPPRLAVLYPFAGRRCDTPEGRLHYVDEGAGPAVVMLHGNPTWSFLFRDLILHLRAGWRCLAPDHLGCGLSDKPPGARAAYTLAGHIARARLWLDALGLESFHLVVHDWGGPIGLGLAAQVPERVRSITLLNTAAFAFPSIPARIAVCRIPVLGTLLVRGANAFVRAAATQTTVTPLSPAVREGYAWPYRSWRDRVAIEAFVRDIPMRPGHRSWATLRAVEASLPRWRGRPVRLVWGMRDWCFHAGILAEWRRRLPEAGVDRFPEAGHCLLEDAGPAACAAIRAHLEAAETGAPGASNRL